MRILPLYSAIPRAPVEVVAPRDRDPSCSRCPMGEGVHTRCVPPEGDPGGLLIVGESPGRSEDARGRPFVGPSGEALRDVVLRHWKGPIAIDNALRCYPKGRELKPKFFDECRAHLAATIREAQPTRVIALGAWSAYSLTGRSIPPLSSRRAYSYLFDAGEDPIPVFFVLHPAAGLRNRFIGRWFEEDLTWAITAPNPKPAPVLAPSFLVDSREDSERAIADVSRFEIGAFDVESAGILWESSFRLCSLSIVACNLSGETSPAYVWTREALADEEARAPLVAWLRDAMRSKIGSNVKFDINAVRCAFGVLP